MAVWNSPSDVMDWPQTVTIKSLKMRPSGDELEGLSFQCDGLDKWPDYTPPGWEGPIQYTVWAQVGDDLSGFIQMWRSRASTGAPILSDFHKNWAYDTRWGPLAAYQPQAGDTMKFFLSAGNARGTNGVTSLRERSNVVSVTLPPGDRGDFTFGAVPAPVPVPGPTPSGCSCSQEFQALASRMDGLGAKIDAYAVSERKFIAYLTAFLQKCFPGVK